MDFWRNIFFSFPLPFTVLSWTCWEYSKDARRWDQSDENHMPDEHFSERVSISETTFFLKTSALVFKCVLYILYRWFINSISIPTVMKDFMQRSSKAGRPTLRPFWWSISHFSFSAGGCRLYSAEISYLTFLNLYWVYFFLAGTILQRMHICSWKMSKQIVCLYWLPWQKAAQITLLLICIRNLR